MKRVRLRCAGLVLLAVAGSAAAQSYRCVGPDGKKYYGQTMPQQCVGQPTELLNAQGMVIRRMGAPVSADDRAKAEAEAEAQKKRATAQREETRRNKALLATYAGENDIETARGRALAENQAAAKDVETRIAALEARKSKLSQARATAKGAAATQVDEDLRIIDLDLKAQGTLLASKKSEVAGINARFDEDKRRYQALSSANMRDRAAMTGEAKSVVITNRGDANAERRNRMEADQRARRDQMELRRIEAERRVRSKVTTLGSGNTPSTVQGSKFVVCNGSRLVCDSRDAVMCNGQLIACR